MVKEYGLIFTLSSTYRIVIYGKCIDFHKNYFHSHSNDDFLLVTSGTFLYLQGIEIEFTSVTCLFFDVEPLLELFSYNFFPLILVHCNFLKIFF